jgi:hypothetical protein
MRPYFLAIVILLAFCFVYCFTFQASEVEKTKRLGLQVNAKVLLKIGEESHQKIGF